ncbi:DUF7555 family protein [Halopiger goleimassiliensis]|uniref:DUF7555 family protein n=1 Tax=Halopiger goleimassiliensis TaxID=1293048 RepID=UPI0018A8724F|nr:hypothetical protein [Halopiger goleimassiliensis]
MRGASGDRVRVVARVAADAVTYALATTVCAIVAAIVVAIATGGTLVRANYLLFFAGWLLMAYATIRLWPRSPADLETDPNQRRDGESIPEAADRTRFQRFVRRLPPRRWVRTPRPRRRLTTAGKLFLSAVLILLASLLLEVVFGVGSAG